MKKKPAESLHTTLERVMKRYHRAEFLSTDPLEVVHRYSRPEDQEAVGLIAALLAYGRVAQIQASIGKVLNLWQERGLAPHEALEALRTSDLERRSIKKSLDIFAHRFTKGDEVFRLLMLLVESRHTYGSLGAHFCRGLSTTDHHLTIEGALNALIEDWKTQDPRMARSFLLTAPSKGSTCKRWCMYLRWMGRKDEVDPGTWLKQGILKPRHLVIPLDVHTGRISQQLGLTARKNLNWQAALEVTARLRELDAEDPVRYDFALCRVGMLAKGELEK